MSKHFFLLFLKNIGGFISGFDGSAGTALVTGTNALLWTDGRYFIQAEALMDENWTIMKIGQPGTTNVPKITESRNTLGY